MGKETIAEGATLEEAISSALSELGAEPSEVEVEVLREPSKGFLGLGGEKALVRLRVDERIRTAKKLARAVIESLGLAPTVSVARENEKVVLSIESGKGLGLLIGRRGETLMALQAIVDAAVRRLGEGPRVMIDAGGYLDRRKENLKSMAKAAAEKAKVTGRAVALGPMSSYERRIVHLELRDDTDVITRSEGEEPSREVLVVPR